MTDYTLQRVLEDLRQVIGSKLIAESSLTPASAKKGTVDCHRGDGYQFAYFFRKNEPHDVLIKSRKFVPASSNVQSTATPPVEPSPPSSPPTSSETRKRGGRTRDPSRAGTKRKKSPAARPDHVPEDGATENSADDASADGPRRSRRTKNTNVRGYEDEDGDEDEDEDDVVMADSDYDPADPASVDDDTADEQGNGPHGTAGADTQSRPGAASVFDVDAEEEEEKPKLSMRVSYQGFTIYDRCLCIVVEPWPRTRSTAPPPARETSLPNPTILEGHQEMPPPHLRERTPLFLPETDPRRSLTPAPLPARFLQSILPHNDITGRSAEEQEPVFDEGGMMAFSQVLKSVGDERTGIADDDENEGEVFLGDADERKGDR